MTVRLTETTPLSEAGESPSSSGRMIVHAITAGLGSSGYYSPEVLQEAANNVLIDKGTPLFLDHASKSGRLDRPERSVRDIAAVFTEAATYDEAHQALVGEVQVFSPYRELLTEMAPHIGLSISGSATDVVEQDLNGTTVKAIEGLAAIDSVDFVTRAGRGGRVVELLESQWRSATDRGIARGVEEATADERREQLSDAVRTAYAGDRRYAWVRDFDDATVWFEASGEDEPSRTWEQAYSVADDDLSVSLTGERTEVRAVTKYVPATRSDNTTTEESKEDTMGNISIEEAEHRRLTEAAGRVDALVAESATKDARIAELEEADARRTRADRARQIVEARAKDADVVFTPREVKGFLADITLTEAGELDEAAFTTLVDEDAAAKKAAGGSGRVIGHGDTSVTEGAGGVSLKDIDEALGLGKGA